MSELQILREGIDQIDRELTRLLEQRLSLTAQVGAYKQEHGLPVLDAERERQVLASKKALVQKEENWPTVKSFFEAVMALSRKQQRGILEEEEKNPGGFLPPIRIPIPSPRILYQGEPGAYGEEAAVRFFGSNENRDHGKTFEDVFLALRDGRADYGVLPMENNSTGAITAVYDLFSQYGCYIVGEQVVPVRHCLMAPAGATLETLQDIYSHEQGFFQSQSFLKAHGTWQLHSMRNTAVAAKSVAESKDPTRGAIGSCRAAQLYGLTILAEGINDEAGNGTRFVIIAKEPEQREGSDKISALFTIPHTSGSLAQVLTVLADHGLNLLKLESRPIAGRHWEYRFFVDFSGNWNDPEVQSAMKEWRKIASLQILGNYKGMTESNREGEKQ